MPPNTYGNVKKPPPADEKDGDEGIRIRYRLNTEPGGDAGVMSLSMAIRTFDLDVGDAHHLRTCEKGVGVRPVPGPERGKFYRLERA